MIRLTLAPIFALRGPGSTHRVSCSEVDEAFLVVRLASLEVVDQSMASPAPLEAPVQRGGLR